MMKLIMTMRKLKETDVINPSNARKLYHALSRLVSAVESGQVSINREIFDLLDDSYKVLKEAQGDADSSGPPALLAKERCDGGGDTYYTLQPRNEVCGVQIDDISLIIFCQVELTKYLKA